MEKKEVKKTLKVEKRILELINLIKSKYYYKTQGEAILHAIKASKLLTIGDLKKNE